jgi:hypothetical protein
VLFDSGHQGVHCAEECGIVGGEVPYIFDLIVDVSQEEVQVSCYLGFLFDDAGIGVVEKRARERIFVAVHGRLGGLDAIDGEHGQGVSVLGLVSVAEETDGVGTTEHALDEDVVVFGELGVGGSQDGGLV